MCWPSCGSGLFRCLSRWSRREFPSSSHAEKATDMTDKALIIVDLQNDYFHGERWPQGALRKLQATAVSSRSAFGKRYGGYVKTTFAPSVAKRRTMAAPIPRLPPSTRTDLPLKLLMTVFPSTQEFLPACRTLAGRYVSAFWPPCWLRVRQPLRTDRTTG